MRPVRILIALLIIIALIPAPAHAAAESYVALRIECPEDLIVGNSASIRINVGKPSVALQAIEFTLAFDPAVVEPVVTANGSGEMDVFITAIPDGWHQYCSYSAAENKYYLRFASDSENDTPITLGSQLIVEVPFLVVASGSAEFVCASADIIAVPLSDPSAVLGGTGAALTAVASSDTEKLSVSLSGEDSAIAGRDYLLGVTVTNLGDPQGIIAAEFELEYDPAVFDPAVKTNANGEMDGFIVSAPGSWEQMCSVNVAAGKYTLRIAAENLGADSSELLSEGASLSLSIGFVTIGSEGATASFRVRSETVVGVNSFTGVLGGRGSVLAVSVEEPAPDPGPDPDMPYAIVGDVISGVPEMTGVADFLAATGGSRITDKAGKAIEDGFVATGHSVVFGSTVYYVAVRGDCNGNGVVDVVDYAMIKRSVLRTYEPDPVQLVAICIDGREEPTVADYAMIKRHVLGTYDINTGETRT